ncbi:hypothetical protein, partial [Ectopseudomonas khazarica]|uniref:hypothetical protein n=1 Tax=Ectopseudomonas khazarica TaxID=2502979 RepID=UPI001ABEEE72
MPVHPSLPEDGCLAVCRKWRAMKVFENVTGLLSPPFCPFWPHAGFWVAVSFIGTQEVHMSYN